MHRRRVGLVESSIRWREVKLPGQRVLISPLRNKSWRDKSKVKSLCPTVYISLSVFPPFLPRLFSAPSFRLPLSHVQNGKSSLYFSHLPPPRCLLHLRFPPRSRSRRLMPLLSPSSASKSDK